MERTCRRHCVNRGSDCYLTAIESVDPLHIGVADTKASACGDAGSRTETRNSVGLVGRSKHLDGTYPGKDASPPRVSHGHKSRASARRPVEDFLKFRQSSDLNGCAVEPGGSCESGGLVDHEEGSCQQCQQRDRADHSCRAERRRAGRSLHRTCVGRIPNRFTRSAAETKRGWP